MNHIEINNLSFSYGDERIIKRLDMKVIKGEFSVIQGSNGSGKSTLLKLILGELKKDEGSIKLMGMDIERIKSFRGIGYVPQVTSTAKISFPITCLEFVSLGLYEDFGFLKIPKKKHREKAAKSIALMGMEDYTDIPFNEMSGGQQQRIMIARAMVTDPSLVLLDEPTVGVDNHSKEKFFERLSDINENRDVTILMVTHELDFAKKYIKKIYRIEDGVILSDSL